MILSNAQASNAEEIKGIVAASDAARTESVELAQEAGRKLVSAKAECKHGQWLPFLDRAGVQERKAQRLMKLASSGLKSDTVTDLGGITRALEFLSKKDAALSHYDDALELMAAGGAEYPLELALIAIDDLIEMFPEEQWKGLKRHEPSEDIHIIKARIAALKTAAQQQPA
ncbi:MAG: DUF3102 domain-containing protein [Mesorhizobium sp.]